MIRASLLLLAAASLAAAEDAKPPEDLDAKKRAAASHGLPCPTGTILAGDKKAVEGATFTEVKLDAGNILPCMVWATDKRSAFILTRDGVIRRVAFPEIREERELQIGKTPSTMALSRSGLVVTLPDQKETRIYKDFDLVPKPAIQLPEDRWVAASPGSDLAFVIGGQAGLGDKLAIVNTASGNTVRVVDSLKLREEQGGKVKSNPGGLMLSNFASIAVSPDGRYLFAMSGDSLNRFRIGGDNIVYEEYGPKVGRTARIQISADSRFVGVAAAGDVDGWPVVTVPGWFIFKVGDLSKPDFSVSSGELRGFGIGNKFLGTADGKQVVVWGVKGLEKQVDLFNEGESTVQMLAHEDGKRFLILTAKHLWWVVLN